MQTLAGEAAELTPATDGRARVARPPTAEANVQHRLAQRGRTIPTPEMCYGTQYGSPAKG